MVSVGPQEIWIKVVQYLAPGTVGAAATAEAAAAAATSAVVITTTSIITIAISLPNGRTGRFVGHLFPVADAVEVSVPLIVAMAIVEWAGKLSDENITICASKLCAGPGKQSGVYSLIMQVSECRYPSSNNHKRTTTTAKDRSVTHQPNTTRRSFTSRVKAPVG